MSERTFDQSIAPSRRILTGLASASALISLMGGCSAEEDTKPTLDATFVQSSFSCVGTTQYIEFPESSQENSYLLMHLEKRNGDPFTKATKAKVKDLVSDYEASLPVVNTENTTRAYVDLPRTVVQLTVEIYAGTEHASCNTLLYPYKPRPSFEPSPSKP